MLVSLSFAQWFPQQSGTTESLHDLFAIDSHHLFACGTHSTVLKTSDGLQWNARTLRGTYSLNSIWFSNTSFGYVVGDSGIVFRTQNNGNDWELVPVPTSQNLNAVFITSSSRVWMGGDSSALYYSDDGQNWHRSSLPIICNLNAVSFTDEHTGLIAADSGRIFTTEDAGAHWELSDLSLDADLLDIACNSEESFVSGTNGTLLRKKGDTWNQVLFAPGHTFRTVSFADSTTIWCAGDSAGTAVLYKSIDRGASWLKQNSALFSPVYGLAFSGRYTGFSCGDNGKVLKTTTGGVSTVSTPKLQYPANHALGVDHHTLLSWDDSQGAEGYLVQIATDPFFSHMVAEDSAYTQTEWNPGPLLFSTHYYWRVRSQNILGLSPWSATRDFTTHATAPHLLYPQEGSLDVAEDSLFRWQIRPEAASYWLEIADVEDFSNVLWRDSTLTDSVTTIPLDIFSQFLYCRLSAKINGGWSAWSDTVSFITRNGLNGWKQLETSTTKNLYDLEFINAHEGWMVGSSGMILHSTNGGVSWLAQKTPVSNLLYGLDFINDETGWVCGSNGTVLSTKNGGDDWEKRSAPSSDFLRSIQFLNDTTGWVAGERGLVSKTNDGGNHWQRMISISNQDYYDLHFINPDTGWIAGTSWNGDQYLAVVLNTKNGGDDWVSLNVQSEGVLKGLCFLDDLHGWACGKEGLLLRTYDGGATWEKQETHTFYDLNDIHFTDLQHGWVTGAHGVCLYSEDGGFTWQPQETGTNLNLYALSITAQGTGWICGNFGILMKSGYFGYDLIPQPIEPFNGEVATTRSHSLVWHQSQPTVPVQIQMALDKDFSSLESDEIIVSDSLFTPDNPLKANTLYYWRVRAQFNGMVSAWSPVFHFETEGTWVRQQSPLNENFRCVFFKDKNNGFVAGTNGSLLTTQNGGTDWQVVSLPVQNDWETIYFSDAANGWIAGSGGALWYSSDGGTHWQTVTSGVTQTLRTIYFRNNQFGWAGGGDENAVLVKTEDGGNSWQPETVNGLNRINQIYFINNLEGWIIGSGASYNANRTIDGGRTWQPFSIGENDLLTSIRFRNAEHGYLSAESGVLYETTDGGNSWKRIPLSTNDNLKNVAIPNPNALVVLGQGVHVRAYPDQNWTTSLSASAYSLNNFFFADSVTGWLVGNKGLILKTTSAGFPLGMNRPGEATIADNFELFQNYPNPFNPITTIRYQLSSAAIVHLSVFNILGQKVAVLMNRKQMPGLYRIPFNAASLASGIYFYRLQIDGRSIRTRKMILLR